MIQRKLVKQITLGILASGIYLGTGVLAGVVVGGCSNPAKQTYEKGVNGGEKAIKKAKGAQDKIDESTRQLQEQERNAAGS
jgi:hypothetical protein